MNLVWSTPYISKRIKNGLNLRFDVCNVDPVSYSAVQKTSSAVVVTTVHPYVVFYDVVLVEMLLLVKFLGAALANEDGANRSWPQIYEHISEAIVSNTPFPNVAHLKRTRQDSKSISY